MFGNLGVHVMQFPSGRFGFVGTLPAILGEPVKASRADVMGGRAFTDSDGEIVVIKFPSFETEAEALQHAAERHVAVHTRQLTQTPTTDSL